LGVAPRPQQSLLSYVLGQRVVADQTYCQTVDPPLIAADKSNAGTLVADGHTRQ
jgi:hypothetical protein